MNLNQLKYFVAVAEHRSFTKAANQFFISQTAITQQIQALEELVGTRLVDRNSRPIALTPAGRVFLREARAILERMDSALWRTREVTNGVEGSLRVGYIRGYEHSALPRQLREFHREFPSILVSCSRCDTDRLTTGLLNREFDLIFTWDSDNLREDERIELRLMEHVPLVVALYAAHPFAQRRSLTRRDLRGETLLFMTPSGSGETVGDAYYVRRYEDAGYQPNILLRTSDVESVIMMVSAEQGICVLPEYCRKLAGSTDNLRFVPLEGEGETEEVLAAWRTGEDSPVVRRFLERL